MPLIPTGNVAKVAVVYNKDEQEEVNTLYFTTDELIPSFGTCSLIGNAVMEWLEAEMLPLLPAAVRALYTETKSIYQSQVPVAFGFPLGTGQGTRALTSEPNNVTIATSFRTGLTGRWARGRNFWPGIVAQDVVDQNELLLTASADILAAYALLEGYVADKVPEARHCIVSLYYNNAPRLQGEIVNVTSYLHSDLTLDSMRKRLPGRGI